MWPRRHWVWTLSLEGLSIICALSDVHRNHTSKTQIALEYAYRCMDQGHVFWVNAGSRETFNRDYREISRYVDLSPGTDDEVWLRVKNWLESAASDQWLLILDNADDFSEFSESISRFIPQGAKGTVIVTTRSRQVASRLDCEGVAVKMMEIGEATQLFLQLCDDFHAVHDAEAVPILLRELDYLPLAIASATAFMRSTKVSPSNYLEWYLEPLNSARQRRKRLLLKKFHIYGEYEETTSVLNTHFVTFEGIEKQLPLAAYIIRLMAFLDRRGIPEELLVDSSLKGVKNEILFRKAITTLLDFSLISAAKDRKTFEIHRMVQLSMEAFLSQHDIGIWKAKAFEVVWRLFPRNIEHENWHTCSIYLPHALVVTSNSDGPKTSSLLYRMAWFLMLQGDYDNAEIHIRRCVRLQEEHGQSDLDILANIGMLALVLRYQGKYDQAEEMNRRALEGRKTVLGQDHPDTLVSASDLALTLQYQGKYEEAEIINRTVLGRREKALGQDHPHTLTSVDNLASVLRSQGKYGEAEEMNRRVLEDREKTLGQDHPDTLNSVDNLALVLQYQGRYDQAAEIDLRALEGRTKVLGQDHPDTLMSASNLALILQCQGNLSQAEEMNRRALEGCEKVLGQNHPDTLTSVSNLASVLQDRKEYDQAEEMNRRALGGRRKTLGDDHPDTLISVNNLASVLQDKRKYDEARTMNLLALGMREKALGKDHPDTLTSVNNLASVLECQGKYSQAEEMNRRALEGREKVLGQRHPHTLASADNLASVLRSQGKHDEANGLMGTGSSGRVHA
jgi:tetratricopeptide (TPR) repeat protein